MSHYQNESDRDDDSDEDNYQTASEGDMDEKETLLTNKVSLYLLSHLHSFTFSFTLIIYAI